MIYYSKVKGRGSMNKILHTPEGVRDIYHKECRKKLTLESELHHVLKLYGYQDIQTPAFEFFDVFRKEIGTTPSKELYKFFDREGETLALRPDITPSIARAAATLYEEEEFPIRLCYIANTFVNHISYQGRLKENTQLGAELIGASSADADAELIAIAADCLRASGLREFQISLGHVGFLKSLFRAAGLEPELETKVRELIGNRNYFGISEVLSVADVPAKVREAFEQLQDLNGGIEMIEKAKQYALDAEALAALSRLVKIYELLELYGAEQYVTFDLSMSGLYGYYTGIIFRGYTFGTGDAVLKGGRYDQLLEKFGNERPSIGFAIVTNELLGALSRQKIEVPDEYENTLVIYDAACRNDAIHLAAQLRSQNKKTELLERIPEKPFEEYKSYGIRNFAGSLVYLKEDNQIEMFNLLTEEAQAFPADEYVEG